jgi:indolepyruvate ferredoxin oxidoreductase
MPEDISAVRVAVGEADSVIGGDLVVTASAKTLGLMARDRTKVMCNSHEIITGEFTKNTEFLLPSDRMQVSLTGRLGEDAVVFLNATELARVHLGDSIFANMLIVGAAWQNGQIPLTSKSILDAISLNGASVEGNKRAFQVGRWAMMNPEEAARSLRSNVVEMPKSLEEMIVFRSNELVAYQNEKLASLYRNFVRNVDDVRLREAVAKSYHKLLAYKDEYEVARLHAANVEQMVVENFDNVKALTFHLAPPFLLGKTAEGHPRKRKFGPWALNLFKLLQKGKVLRGTPLDLFGYTAERRMERALIKEFELDVAEVLPLTTPETQELV